MSVFLKAMGNRILARVRRRPAGWRGEVCKRCRRPNVVGYTIPDEVWDLLVGEETIVCLTCLDELAAPLGVDWTERLELYPVSTARWREHVDLEEAA